MRNSPLYAFALSVLVPMPALAHMGTGMVSGFTSGFDHPIGGFDHLLAMIAVGLGLGLAVKKAAEKIAPVAVRIGGGVIAASGVALLAA